MTRSFFIFIFLHNIILKDTFLFQGTPIKDVEISDKLPNTLLLEKHISYIAAYGEKKDDFVSCLFISYTYTGLQVVR